MGGKAEGEKTGESLEDTLMAAFSDRETWVFGLSCPEVKG